MDKANKILSSFEHTDLKKKLCPEAQANFCLKNSSSKNKDYLADIVI